jgi:hypothetical protein
MGKIVITIDCKCDEKDECCGGLYDSCCQHDDEEQVGCGACGGDDDSCDGKESCCTSCETQAHFPTLRELMDEVRGRRKFSDLEEQFAGLDAQVEEERKIRSSAFKQVIMELRGNHPTHDNDKALIKAMRKAIDELMEE